MINNNQEVIVRLKNLDTDKPISNEEKFNSLEIGI